MPRFHFHLRARGRMHRGLEATELPNLAAAKAHAAAVAEELMLNSGGSTRHWSLRVENESGESQFDLYFADIDPTLAAYPPHTRMLVSQTCRRLGALTDALCAAQATRIETSRLLARARGKPQLVYAGGE